MSCPTPINALFSAVPFPQALAELEEWLRRHNIRIHLKQGVHQAQDRAQPQMRRSTTFADSYRAFPFTNIAIAHQNSTEPSFFCNRSRCGEMYSYSTSVLFNRTFPACDSTQTFSKKSNDTRAVEVGGAGERDGAEGAVAGRDGHGEEGRSFVWATCGDWDLQTIFPRQCAKSGVCVPASMRQWCNLKIVYNSAQVP